MFQHNRETVSITEGRLLSAQNFISAKRLFKSLGKLGYFLMQDDKALQTKIFIWEDEKAEERAPAAIEERVSQRKQDKRNRKGKKHTTHILKLFKRSF